MAADLSPDAVAARLEQLRGLYVPLREDEARALMEEVPPAQETFADAVARRLDELRALMDLTDALHRPRR